MFDTDQLADLIWTNLAADTKTHHGGGDLLKMNRTQLRGAVALALDEIEHGSATDLRPEEG